LVHELKASASLKQLAQAFRSRRF